MAQLQCPSIRREGLCFDPGVLTPGVTLTRRATLTSGFQKVLQSDLKRRLHGVTEGLRIQGQGIWESRMGSRLPILHLCFRHFPELQGSPLRGSVKVRKETVTEIPFRALLGTSLGKD